MDTKSMTFAPTDHFLRTMIAKGFTAEQVLAAWNRPAEVYPSGSHPGQWRVTGEGVCIVGKPQGKRFIGITVYADRVVTPVREDQMNTPEGRRFAEVGRQGGRR